MSNITDSRDAWPLPAITEASKHPNTWVEISEAHTDDLLNAVPPIYIPGGFMVGEPADHDADGCPIYCAVIGLNGRNFARHLRYDERKRALLQAQAAYLQYRAAIAKATGGEA